MKITFIDPTQSVINYGLRALAQFLVNAGHDVRLVFLNQSSIQYNLDYPESFYNDLYKLVEDADVIGFSFVSNYLGQAETLTRKIKNKFSIPVIWGGIHAIAAPEKSLEVAEMVCVGEGESCMLGLLQALQQGTGLQSVPNLWYKKENVIIQNETAPLNPSVDDYSFPLYNNSMEFIRRGNNLVAMDDAIRKELMGVNTNYYSIKSETTYSYLTLASRGCPFSCSYCCNNLFTKIYKRKGKLLRRRSNEEIINELEMMIRQMPYINVIEFFDDDFIFADEAVVAEFASLYKKRIGLPFRCNFRPDSVTYEKLSHLNDAGLISVEMGLQSASPRINKLFNRHFNKTTFIKAANIINKFSNIVPNYDIIVDNPFEQYEDISLTLRFISGLPQPYKIAVFSLTFFPGTQLYEYAKSNHLLNDEIKNIINKKNYVQYEFKQPYVKLLLLYMRKIGFKNSASRFIFTLLTTKFLLMIFDSFVFYPLWFSVLFSKRVLSRMKSKDVQLIPG